MTTLYAQIHPKIPTTLKTIDVKIRAEMAEYTTVLNALIDSFKARMMVCLRKIHAPDLFGFHKEMAILRAEVRSLAES